MDSGNHAALKQFLILLNQNGQKKRTEEPLEDDETKIVDLSPLEVDEVQSEPEETITKRLKLNPQKKRGTESKF